MNPQSKWLPLESDPDILNEFAHKLGMKPHLFSFQELVSIQEWAQQLISQPVLGIIFLYEESQPQVQYQKQQAQKLNENQVAGNIFFMEQFADYACGTIALFHILLNSLQTVPDLIEQDSILKKFHEQCQGKSSKEIGKLFQQSENIQEKHSEAVCKGQTVIAEEEVEEHFIAFIEKNGKLYELDGCKKCPVDHGQCSSEELLRRSCEVMGQFMKRDPEGLNFSLMVLAKRWEQ